MQTSISLILNVKNEHLSNCQQRQSPSCKLRSKSRTKQHSPPSSLLVASANGVVVLLDGGVDVWHGEVLGGVELLGGHVALEVGLAEQGAPHGRAVPAAVADEVLDVVYSLRVGGGHDGHVAVVAHGGRALDAVLERARQRAAVLGRGAGARDLPRLLKEPAEALEHRLAGAGGGGGGGGHRGRRGCGIDGEGRGDMGRSAGAARSREDAGNGDGLGTGAVGRRTWAAHGNVVPTRAVRSRFGPRRRRKAAGRLGSPGTADSHVRQRDRSYAQNIPSAAPETCNRTHLLTLADGWAQEKQRDVLSTCQ
jgi:hypothetical protein